MRPAGFWRRYAAYSLDVLVPLAVSVPLLWGTGARVLAGTDAAMQQVQFRLFELMDAALAGGADAADPLGQLLAWSGDPVLREGVLALVATWLHGLAIAAAVLFALSALWFVGFEASRWQATPGKRLAGLRVTALDGGRPAPWRVVLRFVAGVPSWLMLHLGHALAGWTKERRALHDLIAGTRVVLAPDAGDPMPRWARRWLWAQGIALAAAVAIVVTSYALLLAEVLGAAA
ncbi:MAG: hypothetical protein ABS41_05320 [Arenimonas sp. SCN 70-307]|uniref:RDD family protein n=1 Tax=Arenimonas sp. SCN 70-307 TaxID=1660089 RepID=UPI00086E1866|nr:RDD family protein [Arenimonas sp. SCN 70-307]ODS63592.1 MAG: hypothetical protein ABS41_05320 [Arenimonas sp. SCN 70-307]